jgi:hypothetical protein
MTTVQLVGADGSTWPLMGLGPSPVKLANEIGGLHLPRVTHLWAQTARGSGRQWRGSRLESREFSLNVYIPDLSDAALFFEALSYDDTSQLVVNASRTLSFRLDEENDFVPVKDPSLKSDVVYPVHCIADRPEWTGTPTTATFPYQATSTTNFFGGGSGTKGPLFYISAADLLKTASISNPGDLPAYPVWTIQGPLSTATVGVGNATITLPFPLQSTDYVIIDAAAQTIVDGQGNSLWPFMGYQAVSFAPVPPGDLVQVAAGMSGGGSGAQISLTLTPLYRRAL